MKYFLYVYLFSFGGYVAIIVTKMIYGVPENYYWWALEGIPLAAIFVGWLLFVFALKRDCDER